MYLTLIIIKPFRFNRVGARIKSEADLEEIMDNLQEQAMEDKKMRSYAVIPPMLLDSKERKVVYQNNNGHIVDMAEVYKSRKFLNVWTPSEKEIFKEKYLQHPKNFGVIASYLDRKSVSDCVQYYYLSKKTENYKQLLRKSRQRTRSSRNNPQKVNSSASTSVVDILTTGVTTRLQREQQQKTGTQQNREISQDVQNPNTLENSPMATGNITNTSSSANTTTNSVINTCINSVVNCSSDSVCSSGAATTTTTVIASSSSSLTVTSVVSPVTTSSVVNVTNSTDVANLASSDCSDKADPNKNVSDFNNFEDNYRAKQLAEDIKVEEGSSGNTGDAGVQEDGVKKEVEDNCVR